MSLILASTSSLAGSGGKGSRGAGFRRDRDFVRAEFRCAFCGSFGRFRFGFRFIGRGFRRSRFRGRAEFVVERQAAEGIALFGRFGFGRFARRGFGLLVAGVWAGLAWHGTGHLPFVISGVVVAILAGVLLIGGRWFDADGTPS